MMIDDWVLKLGSSIINHQSEISNSPSVFQARVEGVAQAVGEHVDAEDEQADRHYRENDQVGRLKDVVQRVRQHVTPARQRWADAEAEEAQTGFGEDAGDHVEA